MLLPAKAYNSLDNDDIQKIFTLGRSLGISYYHFTDLSDKSNTKAYADIKKEYSDTFQSLNIMEIILKDICTDTESYMLLKKLRTDFYNSLQKQDILTTKFPFIKQNYDYYYKSLTKDIKTKFSAEGEWVLAIGFYSSFQRESINSLSKTKLLLSGIDKIISAKPIFLPENILENLKTVSTLEKTTLNDLELISLKASLIKIAEYFDGYTGNISETNKLAGNWKGVLIDPENQLHKISLSVNNNASAKMNIDGIAQNIAISDVKIVNNYSTFMFKPFGAEKLYIKFNAKISNNILAGEAVDVLGQQGNWVLSRIIDYKN